jgi:hypothetical protein
MLYDCRRPLNIERKWGSIALKNTENMPNILAFLRVFFRPCGKLEKSVYDNGLKINPEILENEFHPVMRNVGQDKRGIVRFLSEAIK